LKGVLRNWAVTAEKPKFCSLAYFSGKTIVSMAHFKIPQAAENCGPSYESVRHFLGSKPVL